MIEINENYIYEKKVIAFIDFLGYKNLIYRNIDKTTTAIIPQIIMNLFEEAAVEEGSLDVMFFSDCMYIVCRKENIGKLFLFLILLTYHALDSSPRIINTDGTNERMGPIESVFLIRGSITYGNVCAIPGKKIIFGPAVCQAYELESQVAIYPRIVCTDEVMDLTKFKNVFFKDNDGLFYLDTLSSYRFFVNEPFDIDLEANIDFLKNQISDKKIDVRISAKYGWFINYLERIKVDNDQRITNRSVGDDKLEYTRKKV